jgi:uncharacterized protein (UPF0371 family)
MNRGFDNEKYLNEQTAAIQDRVQRFHNKLYLEFGGKLIYDYHAARVLPGFDPNVKMRLLQKLKESAEVILCIYAGDIERKRMRGDFGISYDADALKLIDDLGEWEVEVRTVVITRYEEQPAAKLFKNKLERRNIRVLTHRFTKGYPTDVDTIVSEEGYGANDYIETEKPIVVVTGPGANSGKLATCLSQLYHEHNRGIRAGYAKFETFPIWNLPLRHPVNVAYEAATADIGDYNMVDSFHLEAYDTKAVNYNRDVEVFPVIKRILERIAGESLVYQSPTDMGVNRAGYGIVDDQAVRRAAIQEVIRRFFRYSCEYVMGLTDRSTVERVTLMMEDLEAGLADRPVVAAAEAAAVEAEKTSKGVHGIYCGAAIQLENGTIVTGKNSPLMHAAASLVLNATKHLAGIPDSIHLLPPNITESLGHFKKDILKGKETSLDLEEALIALCISAAVSPSAQAAVERLEDLHGCEVHVTHIPTPGDEAGLRKLGVNLTSNPNFASKTLFFG